MFWGYGLPGKHTLVHPKYQEVRELSEEGSAAVKSNGKWGFTDRLGNEVISCAYDDGLDFLDDWGGDEMYYGFKNEWSDTLFKIPQKFRQRYAAVKIDDKWGFINKQGEITLPIEFDEALNFVRGYAFVKLKGRWGIIDLYGKSSTQFIYDEVREHSEWVPPVRIGNKWGYVTRNGKFCVTPIFDDAYPFQGDYAIVQSNGKWGYIDGKKDVLSKLEEKARDFKHGNMEDVAIFLEAMVK